MKKFLACALALTLTSAMFASCGSSDDSSSKAEAKTTTTTTTTTEPASSESTDESKDPQPLLYLTQQLIQQPLPAQSLRVRLQRIFPKCQLL